MRRTNGRGSLFQRGGTWFVAVKWQGRRYRWSSRSTRRTDAEAFLAAKIKELQNGVYRPWTAKAAGPTVKALAEAWVKAYVMANRDAKGQKQADRRVVRYLAPFMGEMPAAKVTKDTLREYRAHLLTLADPKTKVRTLTDSTVKHLLSDARCLFLWAADTGKIEHSPVPRRLMPKVPESPVRSLSPEDQAKAAAVEEPFGLAVRIMLGTGVRWSELCRLQASDVDKGQLVIHGPTKSRRMRRVPLSTALLAELRGHVGKIVPFERKDDPAFNRSVRLRSGVEEFSAHRCRHSFALGYMSAGGNLTVLQQLMGHSTPVLTAAYARPTDALIREDAARVLRRAAGGAA